MSQESTARAAGHTVVTGTPATEADFKSAEWLCSHAGIPATAVDLEPLEDAGGLSGVMRKLTVTTASSPSPSSYILKFSSATTSARSKSLGLAREAFFYNEFSGKVGDIVPSVSFAYGNMETGEKTILMADLSSYAQSGFYFGACSPHNWRKDLESITGVPEGKSRQALTHRIASHAFTVAAKVHSAFWCDRSLQEHSWLRGTDWLKGEGKNDWLVAQSTASDAWHATTAKILAGESKVKWSPHLLACMRASIEKISWENFQSTVQSPDYSFTLVHGDYHPANMMWKGAEEGGESTAKDSLILLDWEAVGAGSGPQDCAQYVISHMFPAERRLWEEELLKTYYSALVEGGVSSEKYSLEQCRAEYVAGGVGRWVWMLALLSGMCPDPWVQFFQDQVAAFIEDHGVTPESICMPRV